jgi:hypothetical protein
MPLGLGGIERIKDARHDILGYANTPILDGYLDVVSLGQGGKLALIGKDVPGRDVDKTAVGHRLLCIDHDVVNHLGNLVPVDMAQPQIIRQGELAGNICPT